MRSSGDLELNEIGQENKYESEGSLFNCHGEWRLRIWNRKVFAAEYYSSTFNIDQDARVNIDVFGMDHAQITVTYYDGDK